MADYILQIPIKESEVASLKAGFLAAEPMDQVPVLDDDNEPTGAYENEYSDVDWIIKRVRVFLKSKATMGLKKLRDKNDPVDTDFFPGE